MADVHPLRYQRWGLHRDLTLEISGQIQVVSLISDRDGA